MTGDLKDATDKLLTSERIAAWQEVARRLAHEIKNPLTPIRMSLETLLAASQRGPLDDRFKRLFTESAHTVLEEVDRLKRIVDEFSQFARLPRPELATHELSDVVQPVMALYADHDGLHFDVSLERGAVVSIDKDQLTQVLVNLVKNAEEAMAGRTGAIHVRVKAGPEVRLEVEDEGPGIPAELKGRLFEPYVTTKPQGTGLGLPIAQRIIQEHGGRLEVADGTAGGALFCVCLPRLSPR
jgi:nitrogen fixation/metabolism regulation signal transduction histidine kinase